MSATVIVVGPRDKDIPKGTPVISTVSSSKKKLWSQLSPFLLGPVELWGGNTSQTMENGWQYSKVYECHMDESEIPATVGPKWAKWARKGWQNPRAVRYPMGRGARPEFSYWDGERFGYVEARAKIYIPLYARAVRKTEAFAELKKMFKRESEIWLWDYDGYDRRKTNSTLLDVLTNPSKKMGHAFVLAMMLEWGTKFYRA